jgi:hypothetical protein
MIILFWIIGGLLKKAQQTASKQQSSRPRPPGPGGVGGGPKPKADVPTLSDFFKRLQEMSGQTQTPAAPPQPRRPTATPAAAKTVRSTARPGTPLQRPGTLRRPTLQRTAAERRTPESVRMEQAREFEQPGDQPQLSPAVQAEAEFSEGRPRQEIPGPETPRARDAYTLMSRGKPRFAQMLEGDMSASRLKQGIILSEILGRPKALRGRRPPIPRG